MTGTDLAREPLPEPPPAATEPAAPGEAEPRRLGTPFLVLQFFLFPMAIVAVCVGVFVVFGLIAREDKNARQYLEEVRRGGGGIFGDNRRWHAAYQLSQVLLDGKDPALRDPQFVSDVLAVFAGTRNDDPKVRRYLAVTLGRLRDRRAVPALLAAATGQESGADPDTQIYAVVALGAIGDPSTLPEIVKLAPSSDAALRKAVAYALGAMPSQESRAALVALLGDPVEDVRWNAALALARRGDVAAAPVLLAMMDRAHMQSVAGLNDDERGATMLEAIRAARVVPDPALRAALERLRGADPSLQVRAAAAAALGP
jgi:HEAT repeat protein